MITYEMVKEAQERVERSWGAEVIMECRKYEPLNMTVGEFLKHCTACGGNWGGMFLTGIKALRPEVWKIIPDDMGITGEDAFVTILYTLILMGVDTSAEE